MKTSFSIRYKFLAATTFLLALCVGTYLFMASSIFKEDKKNLLFDYNRSLVVNLASDIDNSLKNISDKMQLVAYFNGRKDKNFQNLINALLEENPDLVWVGSSDDFATLKSEYFKHTDYHKTYGLKDNYFKELLTQERPIPFDIIRKEGQAFWPATGSEGPPALGFGKSIIEEDQNGYPVRQFLIIAFIRADRILAALKEALPNQTLVTNARGEVLASYDKALGHSEERLPSGLFTLAQQSATQAQVVKFQSQNQNYFGAFAKTKNHPVIVLSSISEDKAFQSVNDLMIQSLLFGSILVTMAFILAILFSRSLTGPLYRLIQAMKKVSDGDLNTEINVRTQDEIAHLADHFNQMIQDLKKSRAQLVEINRDLEKKVQERTLQLEERNHAVKEAQEALLRTTRLAAVGEVAGLAAHEVLNPLTSIISKLNDIKTHFPAGQNNELQLFDQIQQAWQNDFKAGGFNQLIQSWQKTSSEHKGLNLWQEDMYNLNQIRSRIVEDYKKIEKDANFLLAESERIQRIIQSFRNMNSSRQEKQEHDLHSLCERAVSIMQDWAHKHKIKIESHPSPISYKICIDEDEFIQAFTNVLRNAIQSISSVRDSGLIEIKSDLEKRPDGRSYAAVRIRDNGAGLAADLEKKIFVHKFTTKSKTEGSGIGLSLSRRLMRAHQGDIELTWNTLGQGAEFTLYIPILENQERRSA